MALIWGCSHLARAGTQRIDVWGWRLSLGLAAVPAIVLTLGGALLPETPNSLIERGHHAQARPPPGYSQSACPSRRKALSPRGLQARQGLVSSVPANGSACCFATAR